MVFQYQASLAPARRKITLETQDHLADSVPQFRDSGEAPRHHPECQPFTIDRKRKILDYPVGVCLLLGIRDNSIPISVDAVDYRRCDRDPGRESEIHLDAIARDQDGCRLEILIHPVRNGERGIED
jgi:hypothetical protein